MPMHSKHMMNGKMMSNKDMKKRMAEEDMSGPGMKKKKKASVSGMPMDMMQALTGGKKKVSASKKKGK